MKHQNFAILWDLDGTIIDTKDCHIYTWEQVLKWHGFGFDLDLFEKNFGRKNQALLPELLGFQPEQELMLKMIAEKEGLFRQIASDRINLVGGVTGWLNDAQGLDYAQAIASSAPIENITTMLAMFNLEDYFTAVVSGHTLPAKPEPDVFLHAANVLQVAPEKCLVIEDSIAGLTGAIAAGMRCIAVTTTHPRTELSQADVIIDDFSLPLIEVLQRFGWE